MSALLSVISAVAGLVALSAQLGTRSKQLYDSARVAPESMLQLQNEMENIHIIFVRVESFVRGTSKKGLSRKGLMMISLHHLMTILTGCVLVLSNIDKKLSEVAGLVDPTTQKAQKNLQSSRGRVKWALWKETEISAMLQDLDRQKLSLNMMLSLIQCNSTSEGNDLLERLRELVDEISESDVPTAVQLRAHMRRQHDEEESICDHSTSKNISDTTSKSFSIDSASASRSSTSFYRGQSDNTPIFSARSIQNLIAVLFGSMAKAYKKLRYPRSGSSADSSAVSFPTLDNSATKGDRWSMLSDITLGQLSISEISFLELPIGLSDLYDPHLYEIAIMKIEAQAKEQSQAYQGKGWPSRGRIHNAIRTNSDFALRTMINLGVDIEEKDSKGRTPLCVAALDGKLGACKLLLEKGATVDTSDASGYRPLFWALKYWKADVSFEISKLLLDKGAAVNAPDSFGQTPLSHAVREGNTNICQLLIEKGAEVNAPDSIGCTPLSYAAAKQKWDICQLLVNKGAEVDALDPFDYTQLLSYAATNQDWSS